MNRVIKRGISIIILLILTIILTGCGKKEDEETLKQKIASEIKYLDTQLINMLNQANGLSFENYIVEAQEVKKDDVKSSTKESDLSTKQGNDSSQGGSSGGSQGEGKSNQSSSENQNKNIQYKMVGNEILLQSRDTDWQVLKANIEKLYSTWSTVVLDLYKINVNSQNILGFNTDLDIATQAIKNENKQETLKSIAKLYSYMPIYSTELAKEDQINNVYNTKMNILNACVQIEQGNSIEVKNQLTNAEQSFLPIINNMNSNEKNEVNINKSYILIKDLQNSSNNTDKDVFYIKYKNLIEQLNIL